MELIVLAGMIDAKLEAKLAPLQAIPEVTRIDLIRRRPYLGDKLVCHSPPVRWIPLAEAWRLATLLFVALFRRPDVIVAFGIVWHGIYAGWIGRLLRIPVIQHVKGKNDMRLTFPGQRGRRLTLRAVKRGSQVAVRGTRMKSWLEARGVSSDHIFVAQNLHDFELFRPLRKSEHDYDLVYVGLLEPYKRLDLMLEALALLTRNWPNTKLLLIGDGSLRPNLEAQAERLNIVDAVTFAGEQPYSELPGWIGRARVFTMTSQGEGLPQALIEAMSCGLPAVVPADADIEDVAQDGINALLVHEPDSKAYAQAYQRLLSDSALYERLREGALALREERQDEYSLEYQSRLWAERLRLASSSRQSP